MPPLRLVVIGGTAAGPKAASKARRLDPHAEITIVQKDPDLSMAVCAYPYYVGGVFDDRKHLLSTATGTVRDAAYFRNVKNITALPRTEAVAIDPAAHTVTCRKLDTGETLTLPYDKLVLATGARPVVPPVPGTDLEGVTPFRSMRDADTLRRIRDEGKVKEAVVVGGGLIGIEAAEALQLAGLRVTVVELMPQILGFLDWELAKLVENHVQGKGGNVLTNCAAAEFVGRDGRLVAVRLRDGTELPCGVAVLGVGVRPNAALAAAAGLRLGPCGGVEVNEFLQTSDPAIYAAGDCIEVPHLVTGQKVVAPLGDLANLQGRVVGQNVVLGNVARFPGTLQTGICKVFDFTAASTGLSEGAAKKAGLRDTVSVVYAGADKPHFMGSKLVVLKLLAEAKTGRLLGVQGVGPGDVARRIAAAAMALHGRLTVADLVNADLPYAPPYSPPIDPLIAAAHVLENKMLGRLPGLSSAEVKAKLEAGEQVLLLDVRGQDEFEARRLGLGERLIPLGALRRRVAELPQDKSQEIICYCAVSLRGYEAASYLRGQGYTNVRVMEGGLAAWPYPREK